LAAEGRFDAGGVARPGRVGVLDGLEQVVAAFEVGLVAVGGERLGVGQGGVVGDGREAAVGGRVVGDLAGLGLPADRVPGAGVLAVGGVGAGPAALLLAVGLFGGFAGGDGDLAGRARVGQRRGGGFVDRGAGFEPALGAGEFGGEGAGRGGDAGLPGGAVVGGFGGGARPDDAAAPGRGRRGGEGGVRPVRFAGPGTGRPGRLGLLWLVGLCPAAEPGVLGAGAGSAVTNRPPLPPMWRIAVPEASVESAA
jgi:hypothetical protein